MGVRWQAILGEIPFFGSYAFHDAIDRLVAARLAEAPLARDTTFHIRYDPAGNAAGGGGRGTIADPFRCATPADLGALIDLHARLAAYSARGRVAFLLRTGDIFRVRDAARTGIVVTAPHITIGAYRTGAEPGSVQPPRISGFKAGFGASGWTSQGGGVYSRVETLPVYWVKDSDDPDDAYRRVSSRDSLALQAGSFHHDGATLWVRTRDGAPPGDGQLEACVSTGSGIDIRADGVRVDGLDVWGWGFDNNQQRYCIRALVEGNAACVVSNCRAYYGGFNGHVLGHYNNTSGGISTWVNVTAGLAAPLGPATASTIMNTYAQRGDHETIFESCTVSHGALEDQNNTGPLGRSIYGHTTGDAFPLSLLIVRNCVAGSSARRRRLFGSTQALNGPVWRDKHDWRACRIFVIGERALDLQGSTQQFSRAIWINGHYRFAPDAEAAAVTIGGENHAIRLNCVIEADFRRLGAGSKGLHRWLSRSEYVLLHEQHAWISAPGQRLRMHLLGRGETLSAAAYNCVFSHVGEGSARICMPNGDPFTQPGGQSRCAYHRFDPETSGDFEGHDRTRDPLTLGTPPAGVVPPGVGSPLSGEAGPLPQDWAIEYDARMSPRGEAPSIGAFE